MSDSGLSSFISQKIFDSGSAASVNADSSSSTMEGRKRAYSSCKSQSQTDSKHFKGVKDVFSKHAGNVSTDGNRKYTDRRSRLEDTYTALTGMASKKQMTKTERSIGTHSDAVIMSIYEKGKDINTRVGLSTVNYVTGELTITEYTDSQLFIRTINKINLNDPTDIIVPSSTVSPVLSRLASILKINLSDQVRMHVGPNKIYNKMLAYEFLKSHSILSQPKLKILLEELADKSFALCSLSSVAAFLENSTVMKTVLGSKKRPQQKDWKQKFRTRYEPIENILLINPPTIKTLELVESQSESNSVTLLRFLNQTCTKMGYRCLKNSILQPFNNEEPIKDRFSAVKELLELDITKQLRSELKKLPDLDLIFSKLLSDNNVTAKATQKINFVLLLKESLQTLGDIKVLVTSTKFESKLLLEISNVFNTFDLDSLTSIIESYLESDCYWARNNIELQNQRIYSIKKGQNGLLDTLREVYKRLTDEILQYISDFSREMRIESEISFQYDVGFFIKVSEVIFRVIDDKEIVNKIVRKDKVDFTTQKLTNYNIKLISTIRQIELISENLIQELILEVTKSLEQLFILTESCSLLDLLCCFATIAVNHNYCIPEISDNLLVLNSRHPILEEVIPTFIANDISSTSDTSRLQIITGTNMTGKSVYLKQVILLCIMSHMGCPVPADSACFPVYKSMHARLCSDNFDSTCSTFTNEMKEISYMMECVEKQSLFIIDELGRGTSISDGFSISLAIIDYLSNFNSTVYISTHFNMIPKMVELKPSIRHIEMSYNLSKGKIIRAYKVIISKDAENAKNLGILSVQDLFDQELIQSALLLSKKISEVSQYGMLESREYEKDEQNVEKVLKFKQVANMVNMLREIYKYEKNIDVNLILKLQNDFLSRLTD